MAMANKDSKVRYVRCPKCHKLLIEFTDVPVYKCGGCDTTLKAKYYDATKGNGTIGSLEINQFNNICHGSSDSGTTSLGKEISSCSDAQSSEVDPGREHDTLSNLSSSSSSAKYNCHKRGESSETGEDRIKENSNTDQFVSRIKTEGTSERNPDEHILTEAEDCLDVEAEKSPKLSTLVSDSLMLSVKLEEYTEYSVTGECGIKEDFNTSQSAFRDGTGDTSKSQPDESIQDETGHCLNEEADKSLKQSQQVSLDDKLAESPESVTQDVTSEEDLVDRIHGGRHGQYLRSPSRSSEAYHGSVSSSEIRSKDSFQKETLGVGLENNKMDTYLLPKLQEPTLKLSNEREMSSFGSNRDESSSRYNVLTQERGTSLDSADFYSVQNWMESEGPSRTASRGSTFHGDSFDCENGSASTKFKHLGKDSLELLKKVDELRHQLGELNDAKEGRRFQVKGNTNQQPSFFNKSGKQYSQWLNSNSARRPPGSYSRMRTSMPQYYQFSQMPLSGQTCCSCLHCVEDHHMQFLPNFGHNVPVRTCDYNMCSHHSKAVNPHLHIGSNVPPCCPKAQTHGMELEKPHYKEKKQNAKRHCRPLSGGAPFVICYNCLKLLQLPAYFVISRRRLQKLQCGACSEVLLLSFPSSAHTTPRTPIKAFHLPSEVGSNSYAPTAHQIYVSHPNNCPAEEDPISLSEEYGISFAQSSTNSSENINGRQAPALTLHRLMGYSSATEVLYQPSDNDEGYESTEPTRPHSYIPSEESRVSID